MKNTNSTQRVIKFAVLLALLIPVCAIAQTKAADNIRNQFYAEVLDPWVLTVKSLATIYDPRLQSVGETDFSRAMSDLTALDIVCRKYPKLTTPPGWEGSSIGARPADWCKMAARRDEIIPKAKMAGAMQDSNSTFRSWFRDVDIKRRKSETDDEARLDDEMQAMLFERAVWQKQAAERIRKHFTDVGLEMPSDIFAEVNAKIDLLKAHIDQLAPARSWKQPPYKDAAVESFIRTKFATAPEFKSAKVVKIGLDYTTWKKREGVSLVGSDSKYKYYKVEHNFYKRGKALVRMPGQPFCQSREWVVGRGAKGIVLVSLGGSGIFMNCQ